MDKNLSLKIVNPILFIVLSVQACTGLIFILRLKTSYLRTIAEIHEYNGMFLVGVAILHVTLNWNWIRLNFFRKTA